VQRPDVTPPPTAASVRDTAASIAAVQLADGCIPWFRGGHADPWNIVEGAMALTAGGLVDEARRAYRWLARHQRRNGSWHSYYRDGAVEDPTVDANFCAYIATGLWHHTLITDDGAFLAEMWPVVQRAVDYVVAQQGAGGEIPWARDRWGHQARRALLTSSSSIHLSLHCAVAAAERMGLDRPDWVSAAAALAHAVAHRPECFERKDRWSMDWYYPVLGGVVLGAAGRVRIAERWDTFVVDGLGVRCVADRPWITSAETCELVLALDAADRVDDAWELFRWVQYLRDGAGGYWTGAVFPGGEHFPAEQSTWSAAAAVLAADALMELTPASGLFRALHVAAENAFLDAVADSA